MIRQTIFIGCLLLCFGLSSHAQKNENTSGVLLDDDAVELPAEMYQGEMASQEFVSPIIPSHSYYVEHVDSLHLPRINAYGQVETLMHPLWGYGMFGGWNSWGLHKGLNVSLGASVFAQFGKNAYHHAGFAENISMLYAMPVTNKLSLAVGGYFNNVNWGRFNTRNAGFSAVMGYQFNEHWEAYLYGQKQATSTGPLLPYYMMDCAEIGDRIGAAVKYNFSPSVSIQVSMERVSR